MGLGEKRPVLLIFNFFHINKFHNIAYTLLYRNLLCKYCNLFDQFLMVGNLDCCHFCR